MSDPAAIFAALRGVHDPETGLDLVSMGLIRSVTVAEGQARVVMTTTTRGCPLAGVLKVAAEAAVLGLPGVAGAEVTLSWDPPWSPAMMVAGPL